jgi:hypothetical protein
LLFESSDHLSGRYSPGQLLSIAVRRLRNYLFREEFHAYLGGARADALSAEMDALNA